jgi:nicotinate phosphoribosyltransferase
VVEEVVYPYGQPPAAPPGLTARTLTVPLVTGGEPVAACDLTAARARVAAGLHSLPWDGLKLSRGEPAIGTRMVPSAEDR